MFISIPFSPKFMQVFNSEDGSTFAPLREELRANAKLSKASIDNLLADKAYYDADLARIAQSVAIQGGKFKEVKREGDVAYRVNQLRILSGALSEAELKAVENVDGSLTDGDRQALLKRERNALTEEESKALIVLSGNPNAQCGFLRFPQIFLNHWFVKSSISLVLPPVKITKVGSIDPENKSESFAIEASIVYSDMKNGNDDSIKHDVNAPARCAISYHFTVENKANEFLAAIGDDYSFELEESIFKRDILPRAFNVLQKKAKSIDLEDLFHVTPCLIDEKFTRAFAIKLNDCDEKVKKIAMKMILANFDDKPADCKRILWEIEQAKRNHALVRNVVIGSVLALVIGVVVVGLALTGVGAFAAGGILAGVAAWLTASLPAACIGVGVATSGLVLLSASSVLAVNKHSDAIEKKNHFNGGVMAIAKKLNIPLADMITPNVIDVPTDKINGNGAVNGSAAKVEVESTFKLKK